MSEEIILSTQEGIATVTLDAPQRRNALTLEMADALVDVCHRIDEDRSIGVAVVTGQGSSFCSGAHRSILSAAAADPSEEQAFTGITRIYDAFVRVGQLKVPTIAAVNGPAVGAGLNLALATDLRIMAEGAVLKGGFIDIGIHPGGGHFQLTSRLGGREVAAAVGLFGAEVDGVEAVRRGLAWAVVPAGELADQVTSLARVAARDPELARRTVRSFRMEVGPPALGWDAALQMEQSVQMWSLRRSQVLGDK